VFPLSFFFESKTLELSRLGLSDVSLNVCYLIFLFLFFCRPPLLRIFDKALHLSAVFRQGRHVAETFFFFLFLHSPVMFSSPQTLSESFTPIGPIEIETWVPPHCDSLGALFVVVSSANFSASFVFARFLETVDFYLSFSTTTFLTCISSFMLPLSETLLAGPRSSPILRTFLRTPRASLLSACLEFRQPFLGGTLLALQIFERTRFPPSTEKVSQLSAHGSLPTGLDLVDFIFRPPLTPNFSSGLCASFF